jgi:hypothetical protein
LQPAFTWRPRPLAKAPSKKELALTHTEGKLSGMAIYAYVRVSTARQAARAKASKCIAASAI